MYDLLPNERGEVRPTDKNTYWKLHHIKDIYPSCNVYGVITRVEKIDNSYDSKGQVQDQYRLKLISKPDMEPMDATIYATLNTLPRDIFIIGNVIRIHRIKVLRFNTRPGLYLSGRLKKPIAVVVFEFNDDLEKTVIYKSDIGARFNELDENTIEYLKPAIRSVKRTIGADTDGFDQEVINDEDYGPSNSNSEPSSSTAINKSKKVIVLSRKTNPAQNPSPQRVPNPRVERVQNPSPRMAQNLGTERVQNPSPRRVEVLQNENIRTERPQNPGIRRNLSFSQNPPGDNAEAEAEATEDTELNGIAAHRDLDSVEIYDEVRRRIGRFMHIHQYSRYCNVACEVVSAYCGNKDFNILRVWDGSRAPCRIKTSTRESLMLNGFESIFGDLKLEAQLEADSMLYDIICWEKHGVDAVQLRTRDWVVLTNLNYVVAREALALHAGLGAERYLTGIEKLKPGHPVYTILKNQMEDARKELREIEGFKEVVVPAEEENAQSNNAENDDENDPDGTQGSNRGGTQRSISRNSQGSTQVTFQDVTQIPLGFDRPLAIRPREVSDEDTQASPTRATRRRPVVEPTSAPARMAPPRTPTQRSPQTTPRRSSTRRNGSQSVPSSPAKEVQNSPIRKSPRTPVISPSKTTTPRGKSRGNSQSRRENPGERCPASEPAAGRKTNQRKSRTSSASDTDDQQIRKLRMTGDRLKRIMESSDEDQNNRCKNRKTISDATQVMEAEIDDSQSRRTRKSH